MLNLFDIPEDENLDQNYILKYGKVCGIDEVGRGPLCGPVVAAAVMLNHESSLEMISDLVGDSKQVPETKREAALKNIEKHFYIGIGIVPNDIIDNINILQATMLAMHIAQQNLLKNSNEKIDFSLVDGNQIPCTMKNNAVSIKQGDSKSKLIGAASIVAKVFRDNVMKSYALSYPHYSLESNKGYGTKFHIQSIKENGISAIHRKTFIKKIVSD